MRVLNLSLDSKVLENGSLVQKRLVALAGRRGTEAERSQHGTETEGVHLTVLVSGERDGERKVSEYLTAYSVGGNKVMQLCKMWRLAKSLILNPRPNDWNRSVGRALSLTQKFDLITVQDAYFAGLIGFLLARKFKIPLEIQVHGLERFSGIRKRLAAFLLPRADRIRAVSERLKQLLASSFNLSASKIYVLPIYAQVEIVKQPSRQKVVPYPFTFLTVGRLVPVKNIGLQIRAFARLLKEIQHVRLVIVGDGPEYRNLQLSIVNYQLEGKVILEGRQDNLGRYYQEADAFLLTSDSEGYGVVVTEAAAHKLPIIMTNVGLAGEFIKHDENGIVIPIGNEDELLGAMRDVLQNPELRARFGEAAFRAFRALPSPERQIEKQIEAWGSLQ